VKRTIMLVLVGHRAGRKAGLSSAVHRWAMTTAAAALVLTCGLFLGISIVGSASNERIAGREPVFASNDEAAVARWMIHSDFADSRQFLLFFVTPLRPDAAPPPGLTRWPEPGEVFLSSALADGDSGSVLKSRYGRFGGEISAVGLASPTERVGYYRPASDDVFAQREGRTAITGFGVDPVRMTAERAALTVEDFGKWSTRDLLVLAGLVILLPALVLLVLAVRSDAVVRDRRLAVLNALGAPPTARAWVIVGEAAAPAILGSTIGYLLIVTATFMTFPLPITGYVVNGREAAGALQSAALAAAGVLIMVVALAVVMQVRDAAPRQTRPTTVRTRFRTITLALFPLGLACAIWGAPQARADGGTRYSPGLIVFLCGVVLVLTTLPMILAVVTSKAGDAMARMGRHVGSPAAVVGGRWLAKRPSTTARLCAASVVGLGLLVQVQVQQTWIIERTRAFSGTPSAIAAAPDAATIVVARVVPSPAQSQRFRQAIGPDNTLYVVEDDSETHVYGSCEAIGKLGRVPTCDLVRQPFETAFSSSSAPGRQVRDGTVISQRSPTVTVGEPGSLPTVGFFIVADSPEEADHVAAVAYANLGKPYVSVPGMEWISGGLAGAAVFTWVLLFGAAGLVLLAAAGALAAAGTFLDQAKNLGVVGTFEGRPGLYLRIAVCNLLIPLAAAGMVGAAIAAFLGHLTLQIRQVGHISLDVLGAGVASIIVMGSVLALLCGLAVTRHVAAWHPTAD
jgi:hypothetical protein